LHGINLSASSGNITALFGMNGSGKSTLCSVLAGTVDARSGQVFLNGIDSKDLHADDRLRNGLFVVTESRSIFPGLTVEENLRLALRSSEHVQDALGLFDELARRRDTPAGMLSGGEQQLLAMAPRWSSRRKFLSRTNRHSVWRLRRAIEFSALPNIERARDIGTAHRGASR